MNLFSALSLLEKKRAVLCIPESDSYVSYMVEQTLKRLQGTVFSVVEVMELARLSTLDKDFAELPPASIMVQGLSADNTPLLVNSINTYNIDDGSNIVIKVPGTLRRNKSITSLISNKAPMIDAINVPPWELEGWVRERLNDRGFLYPARFEKLLASMVGSDLIRLELELDKLWVFCGSKLHEYALETIITKENPDDLEGLSEALLDNDSKALLEKSRALGGGAIPSLRFLWTVSSKVYETGLRASAGESVEKIAEALKVKPFLVSSKYIPGVRRLGLVKALRVSQACVRAEVEIKENPGVDPWDIIDFRVLGALR